MNLLLGLPQVALLRRGISPPLRERRLGELVAKPPYVGQYENGPGPPQDATIVSDTDQGQHPPWIPNYIGPPIIKPGPWLEDTEPVFYPLDYPTDYPSDRPYRPWVPLPPVSANDLELQYPAQAAFVRTMYQKYLGRTGAQIDKAGLDYWIGTMVDATGNPENTHADVERAFDTQARADMTGPYSPVGAGSKPTPSPKPMPAELVDPLSGSGSDAANPNVIAATESTARKIVPLVLVLLGLAAIFGSK